MYQGESESVRSHQTTVMDNNDNVECVEIKISAHIEEGERLENLSWRLFYLSSTMPENGENGSTQMRSFKVS